MNICFLGILSSSLLEKKTTLVSFLLIFFSYNTILMSVDWRYILPSLSLKCVTQLLLYLVFPGNLPRKAFLQWIRLNHIVFVINQALMWVLEISTSVQGWVMVYIS